MIYDAYLITCLTNLHVGSGDTTFGVVDKLVQRDPVTHCPTIHSSSLKGALREHFNADPALTPLVTDIFGAPSTSDSQQQGSFCFFNGHLLALPARSDSRPFFMATAPSRLKSFTAHLKRFGITADTAAIEKLQSLSPAKGQPMIDDPDGSSPWIESCQGCHAPEIATGQTILGTDPALFHEADFKALTEDLPVVARNFLENGESKNLWYEEIVPHTSLFFCIIGKGDHHGSDFDKAMENAIVQIGANATIGYGCTRIQKLNR